MAGVRRDVRVHVGSPQANSPGHPALPSGHFARGVHWMGSRHGWRLQQHSFWSPVLGSIAVIAVTLVIPLIEPDSLPIGQGKNH